MTHLEQLAHDYAESQSSGLEGQARADKYITCYNAFIEGAGDEKWNYVERDGLPEVKGEYQIAFDAAYGIDLGKAWYSPKLKRWFTIEGGEIRFLPYAWRPIPKPTPPPLKPV